MISFVIPLYNEVENLADLHAELASAIAGSGLDEVEFLFIDDGSTDGSWRVVEDLAADDPRVRGVRFRRNFGKAAALTAGFRAAGGELVFTLDGDLQDDPAEIPRFLAKLDEGAALDLVSGWKRKRHDPWHKVGPSRIFNRLVSRVIGLHLHDHNCGYKLYRRAVLDEVRIYGELHRFVPALAHARGFRIGEIEVHHRARVHGRSKYGVSRFLKGLIDLVTVSFLTRYGSRPLHAFGTIGLSFVMIGLVGLVAIGVARGLGSTSWPVAPVVLAATALATGVQLIATGLVAERVTASRISPEDTYSVAETVGAASPVRAGGLP
jgi:glycosyltransferase involved in cell wall biosynthesis